MGFSCSKFIYIVSANLNFPYDQSKYNLSLFKLYATPSFTTENLKASRSIELVMFSQAIVFSDYKKAEIFCELVSV